MMLKPEEAYKILFCDYPDVVNVKQMCAMLGDIGKKTGYRLLRNGEIRYFTVGRNIRIPKVHVIDYLAVIEKVL